MLWYLVISGSACYELSEKVKMSREFSRSLFVVKKIKKGDVLKEENVRSIRPSYGLAPKYLNEVIGKREKQDLVKGSPLS
jgi:pseudaminic acid synthase